MPTTHDSSTNYAPPAPSLLSIVQQIPFDSKAFEQKISQLEKDNEQCYVEFNKSTTYGSNVLFAGTHCEYFACIPKLLDLIDKLPPEKRENILMYTASGKYNIAMYIAIFGNPANSKLLSRVINSIKGLDNPTSIAAICTQYYTKRNSNFLMAALEKTKSVFFSHWNAENIQTCLTLIDTIPEKDQNLVYNSKITSEPKDDREGLNALGLSLKNFPKYSPAILIRMLRLTNTNKEQQNTLIDSVTANNWMEIAKSEKDTHNLMALLEIKLHYKPDLKLNFTERDWELCTEDSNQHTLIKDPLLFKPLLTNKSFLDKFLCQNPKLFIPLIYLYATNDETSQKTIKETIQRLASHPIYNRNALFAFMIMHSTAAVKDKVENVESTMSTQQTNYQAINNQSHVLYKLFTENSQSSECVTFIKAQLTAISTKEKHPESWLVLALIAAHENNEADKTTYIDLIKANAIDKRRGLFISHDDICYALVNKTALHTKYDPREVQKLIKEAQTAINCLELENPDQSIGDSPLNIN